MASFSQGTFVAQYAKDDDESKTRLAGFELENDRKPEYKHQDMDFDAEDDYYIDDNGDEYEYEHEANEATTIGKALKATKGIVAWGSDGADKEFVTNPYSETIIRAGGDDALKGVFKFLDKYCQPHVQSGTHINISKLDGDSKKTYNNLWWFMMFFGEEARKIFGRESSWAKLPQETEFNRCAHSKKFYEIWQGLIGNITRKCYQNKSIMITNKDNRYEFRGGKATTDIEEALAWAEFCLNVTNIAAADKTMEVPFYEYLQGDHIKSYAKKHCSEDNKERFIRPDRLYLTPSNIVTITSRAYFENKVFGEK